MCPSMQAVLLGAAWRGHQQQETTVSPLTTYHGRWSRKDSRGSSLYQTAEQRTCIVPGTGIMSRGSMTLLISINHFQSCPHKSPKDVHYCSCMLVAKSPALRKCPLSPRNYPQWEEGGSPAPCYVPSGTFSWRRPTELGFLP